MSLEIGNCPDLVSISISAHQNVWDFCKSCPSLQILWCGVEGLPPVLPPLTSIEELIVSNCPNLISITDLGRELYSLSLLKFEKCPNFANIRGFASLRRLVMSSCRFIFLPERLESCEELVISDCPNLIRRDCWGELHSLTKLQIENCLRVEYLPNCLESCKELIISNCPNLRSDCWGQFSLTKLEIKNCPNLTSFASMGGAASLRRLVVSSCGVENLPKRLEICEELIISDCPKLTGGFSGDLRYLTKLEIEKCPNVKSFGTIYGADSLRRLVVSSCGIENLSTALQCWTSLEELEILNCDNLIRIPDLREDFSSLIKLRVMNCPKLISLVSIQGASSLQSLTLSLVDPLPIGLESCKYIQRLQISGCPNLISFPDLGGVPHLKELEIRFFPRLTSFLSLQDAISLKRLVITFCDSLEALSNGLQSCWNLEELTIWRCNNLKSIPDLGGLLSLTDLSIRYCPQLRCTSVRLPDCLKTLVIGPFCEELELHSHRDLQRRPAQSEE